jgi:hypothetical protein
MAKKFTTVLKEIDAARRRQEREQLRQQRHAMRLAAESDKMEIFRSSTLEAAQHEATINSLVTLHRECTQAVPWEMLASSSPPLKPDMIDTRARLAQENLDSFSPSLESVAK